MNIPFESLLNLATLLLGGGGGAFFAWRYQRKKAKAEAAAAEIEATKELQDLYQQMLADAKSDREDRIAQNEELRQERDRYKDDRNQLREEVSKLGDEMNDLRRTIARLGRKVDAMAPYICGRTGCKNRVYVTVNDDGRVS